MRPGPIRPDETEAFQRAVAAAFHDTPTADRLSDIAAVHEPGRELVARDDGRIVATSAVQSLELTVPGAVIPAAGVTAVGVVATHRRRGLATALMRGVLDAVRDAQREPVAILWASEGPIYGRFGYGPAASIGALKVRTPRTELRPPRRQDEMTAVLELDLPAARDDLQTVFEDARPHRPGMISRSAGRWTRRLTDRPEDRQGSNPLRAVVIRGPAGRPEAYATYAVKRDWVAERGEAIVHDGLASTARGHRALWDFLAGLDLVDEVDWLLGPADEEIGWAVTDPRVVRREPQDGLWLRFVDVDRALAARRYARELDVVLDVEDAFCPQSAGRRRLTVGADGRASCAPTTDRADVSVATEALAAAYLGGPSFRALADGGLAEEHTPGAVDAVAIAFRATREPWCPDVF